ncbi:nickel-dependent lactate racemase family protein [Selenihalanaerobacter shriftii]|uniref:Nickel-dependent lactate racemase n=1 Tax=Selenihalanaerobacter shriftii TaxID=142842 RepID=A0A1T4K1Y0_9FIRM|nr:nickel-dependent lactate racemase [Selenihalanaerobacter shriftii]SJZ36393.1 Nickel-dependent lactate racemase [Selenihalanaerobacter shriftii]
MELKYGEGKVSFEIDESKVTETLLADEKEGVEDPLEAIKESIKSPIGTDPLLEVAKRKSPKKVVIIVNDVSRPTPYNYILPPILEDLHEAGIKKDQITFIIATGIHDPHTDQQNEEIFGKELVENYSFKFHNPDEDLVNLGELSSGNTLHVNKEVVDADMVITTGVILPHYFAGFSGGRKSILPGVAGRDTIQFNHARMVKLLGNLPPLEENPVSLEMFEAANKVGVDFILNIVTNSEREIVKVVAGDLEEAWYAGTDISSKMYHVPLKEKTDVAIVSAGGYPRDINIYQAQKALDHADHGTKLGGTIIWVAKCQEGLAEEVFENWMYDAQKPEDNVKRIKKQFVIGGHKAYAISQVACHKEIILVSDLDEDITETLFAKKMDSVQAAIDYVEEKYNGDYNTIVMPQGSLTVPTVDH